MKGIPKNRSLHSLVAVITVVAMLFSMVGFATLRPQNVLAASDLSYDMTTDGATAIQEATINGAIWKTLPVADPTGSGVWHAFFRVDASPTERGYNTDGRPLQFDEMTSETFTHSALLADVPLVQYPEGTGPLYYEFQLDINESKNTPYISLDQFQVWTTNDPNLLGYTEATGYPAGSFAVGTAELVYDLDGDGDTWIKMDYRWNTGSGKRDYKVLVPQSAFISKELAYVVIFTRHGISEPSDDGFEEWGVAVYPPAPAIDITKTGDELSKVGDGISYTITITNTGNIGLENITVVDTLLGDLSGSFADTLAVGGSESHDFPYTVQLDDPDPLPNTVTVHSDPVGALTTDVTDSANHSVDLVHPGLDVTKEADNTITKVGDTVHFTITVTNTGDVDLNLVSFMDTLMADISGNFSLVLAPLATESYGYDYVTQAGDPDPLKNTAVAHYGITGLPNDITDKSKVEVDVVHPKTEVTITPDVLETLPGGNVILTITENNTGDVALENVYVELDPGAIVVLDKDTPNNPPASTFSGDAGVLGILDIGETWTWTYQVTISVDTEFIVNGFGKVVGLPNIISYDTGYLLERAEVLVKVIGATRTMGFWKTHLDFTENIFDTYLPDGIHLGTWGGETWDITTIEQLMGIMWASPPKNCDDTPRYAIDQARIQAAQQAIAAILNDAMLGGGDLDAWLASHGITKSIIEILEGDKLNGSNSIHTLQQVLDDFNKSGDNIALDPLLTPTGRANPTQAQIIADVCWANTTPEPPKGKH